MIPGLFLGVRLLLALDANVAEIIAGLVVMGVGGVTLLAIRVNCEILKPSIVLPGVTRQRTLPDAWNGSPPT
jgi:hypothetical protein